MGLRQLLDTPELLAQDCCGGAGYGPLICDRHYLFDLPRGFSYKIISRSGLRMHDGLFTPALPDGMAAFPGPDGLTILVRNHEALPTQNPGAFGKSNELIKNVDVGKLYDPGSGVWPHHGGTSTR